MSKLLDNPAAYAAGLIDGEGCIRIIKYSNITYKVTVEIKMCDIEGVRYLHDFFGGKLSLRKVKNLKHSDVYSWMLHGRKACTFLKRIMPYLHVKRRNAEIATLCGSTAEYSTSHCVPSDIVTLRERCYVESRKANTRGTSAAETNREDLQLIGGCDSPNCINDKDAESSRNEKTEPIEGEWV